MRDVEVLTEYVRTALRRSICNTLVKEAPDEDIHVLTVSGEVEELLKEGMQSTPAGLTVAIAPDVASRLLRQMTELIDQMIANGQQPVVLTAPQVRLALRKLTAANFPTLFVLSYNEIAPEVGVSAVGIVRLDNEDQEIYSDEHAFSPPASP